MPSLQNTMVLKNLQKKGFVCRDGDHSFLYYETPNGKRTAIRTKLSHGGKGDLSSGLVAVMARQCHLSTTQFCEFASCHIDQTGYEQILRTSGYYSHLSS